MKQLVRIPILFSLLGIVAVGLVDNARAFTFEDDANTKGLWHMDAIDNLNPQGGYQDFVDDDNSFGAPDRLGGRELLLGVPGEARQPTFLPTGGPDGSGALEFDGVDDAANAYNVWTDLTAQASIDFSMRPDALPDPQGDNFMGLVGVAPLQLYLMDDGSGQNTGTILAIAFYEEGGQLYLGSQGGLALGEWHNVHADVTDTGGANGHGELTLIVDKVPHVADMDEELGNSFSWESQAVMGRMVAGLQRYFDGALDEVRIATEPYDYPDVLGDFDDDRDVDGNDFLVWQRGGSPNGATPDDLAEWQNHFGDRGDAAAAAASVATAAVPEPASTLLMLLGLGWLAAAQR